MLTPDMAALRESAKGYILYLAYSRLQLQANNNNSNDAITATATATPTPLSSSSSEKAISIQMKKFPNLFQKVTQYHAAISEASGASDQNDLQNELNRYSVEVMELCVEDSLHYWRERKTIYPGLSPVAHDLLAAPASEAYVERIFSLTGYLTSGRRNRMSKSMQMRTFLKLNKALFV